MAEVMAMASGSRQSSYRRGSWRQGRLWLRLASIILLLLAAGMPGARAQTTQPALPEADAPALPLPAAKLGDFDVMKQRRLIRILVPFSRTIYFLDKGAERG